MHKTLIDPFELASRSVPTADGLIGGRWAAGGLMSGHRAAGAGAPPRQSGIQARSEEPVAEPRQSWVPRREAWARVRCWCSEE
jgi:hypothetical protein